MFHLPYGGHGLTPMRGKEEGTGGGIKVDYINCTTKSKRVE